MEYSSAKKAKTKTLHNGSRMSQLNLLLAVKTLLDKNNIECFLMYGTLMGAVREGKFLAHDTNDIDIGLHIKDYWKVRILLQNDFYLKFKYIWRTELCVYLDDTCHLDMFFFEEKDDTVSTCAYINNKNHSGINIESQMVYSKENFYPLKTMKFCGQMFNIPQNPQALLKANYGEDWETPNLNWNHTQTKSLNESHRTVGILITTFLRDDKMMTCIRSILDACDSKNSFRKLIRIYIADQGKTEWSPEKILFYDELKAGGHKVFKTPFNSGISYNRNFLVKKSEEPYLMIIDDDFEFTSKTNIPAMIEILNHKEENGIVGGNIENRPTYHADFVFEKLHNQRVLHRIIKANELQRVECLNKRRCDVNKEIIYKYRYTDIVLNFFLAKREVLEQIPWDNKLSLVEHSDHFLRIKKHGMWKICHAPDVTCKHLPEQNTEEYEKFRWNKKYTDLFLNKWGIKKINTIIEEPIAEIRPNEIDNKKIKVVQIARIPCANSGFELSKLINQYSNAYESRYILGAEYTKNNQTIPYRQFPYDLFWQNNKEECIRVIKEAEIIHIHHDIWPELVPYLEGKQVVSTLYNLTNSLQYKDSDFNKKYIEKLKSFGEITVADQPLQRKMFSDMSTLYVPLVKMLFNKIPANNQGKIVVGFAPTNRENVGIGSKRFSDVMSIIEVLQKEYDFDFTLIEGLPYEENLKEKGLCDILIDDVDDNYEKGHNTTIESALLDAVPLTNYTGKWFPAVKTDINTLEDTLRDFLTNPEKIKAYRQNVLKPWRENIYTPENLLNIYQKIYYNLNVNEIKAPIIPTITPLNTFEDVFLTIDALFKANNVKYCLLKRTCLDAVLYGEPRLERLNLDLGVHNLPLAETVIKSLNCGKIKVCLEEYKKPTKLLGFMNSARNVPSPVIPYLRRIYGARWKTLKLDKE